MKVRIWKFLALAVFSLVLAASASAQQAQDTNKGPELTQTQQLQLDNLRKDFRIAGQQVELLKVQLAEALRAQQTTQDKFWNLVADLRTKVKAPEADFDFDAAALRFVPKKKQAVGK